jgi:hypothetical protein
MRFLLVVSGLLGLAALGTAQTPDPSGNRGNRAWACKSCGLVFPTAGCKEREIPLPEKLAASLKTHKARVHKDRPCGSKARIDWRSVSSK